MFPVLTHPQYLWGVVELPHSPQMAAQVNRMPWPLIALLIVGAGCGGGPDGTPVAPPTAPTPTPPPAPEPAPPPDPPIEITPVGRGISVTAENQILLELMSEDVVSANPLDLAGRTLMFTPAGGGYSREVRALDWEEEADDAERMLGPAEVELEHFRVRGPGVGLLLLHPAGVDLFRRADSE